jgi:LL-diaminopimelate aminotransferase
MENNPTEIKTSARVNAVEDYYFAQKLAEINRLKNAGRSIINLGIGNPDLPPSEHVVNTLISCIASPNAHGYQSYNGIPALRNAYTAWYNRHFGVSLDAEQEILPLMGSKEGIAYLSLALLDPGDIVLVPDPGYPAYAAAAKLAGASVLHYDLLASNDWMPDFAQLEKLCCKKVRLMWINYPHMPTGTNASLEQLRKLSGFAHEKQIILCNDNPYCLLQKEKAISLLHVADGSQYAAELNSLSKSHNLAGWRMGVLCANKKIIAAVSKVKNNIDTGMFLPLMQAATEALSAPDSWYINLQMTYEARRKVAENLCTALGCAYRKRQTGMFLWASIPDSFSHAADFTEYLLGKHGIFVAPGHIFGNNGKKYFRVSLCSSTAIIKEAANIISKS